MKKILLILISIFSIILLDNVKAKELPTFEVGSYDAINGEEFTIPITLSNNKNCSYLGFKITYDTNSLDYVNSSVNGLKNAQIKDIKINDDNVITLYALTVSEDEFIDDNGTIANITFKVKDQAKDSKVTIKVTDYGDIDLNKIDFKSIDGTITIYNKVEKDDEVNINNELDKDTKVEEWTSSNEDIAQVDNDGNIKFKSDGEVTITGTDSNGNTITKTYKVGDEEDTKKEKEDKKKFPINIIIIASVILIILVIVIIFIFKNNKLKNAK